MWKAWVSITRMPGRPARTKCIPPSLELSDTTVYKPYIRTHLGTAAHFCEVVALKLRTVPIGTGRFESLASGACTPSFGPCGAYESTQKAAEKGVFSL